MGNETRWLYELSQAAKSIATELKKLNENLDNLNIDVLEDTLSTTNHTITNLFLSMNRHCEKLKTIPTGDLWCQYLEKEIEPTDCKGCNPRNPFQKWTK